jgi:uncharacterized NAD-dependent epimerase/dehydratase family protein
VLILSRFAGAAEDLVMEAAKECDSRGDVILVEGQGSLVHPGYSGVTLAILHGAAPQAMILCHEAGRERLRGTGRFDFVAIPSLSEMIRMNEAAAASVRPAHVLGISLKTAGLPEDQARSAIREAELETGLPVADTVRFGSGPLAAAIREAAEQTRRSGEPPGSVEAA